MTNDSFDFQIPGLTEAEEDVVDAFSKRMHEIAEEEGHPLDIWADGGPVLVRFVAEGLPDYSFEQRSAFMFKVLEALGSALSLNKQKPEGSA
jgi:hypothetical protein